MEVLFSIVLFCVVVCAWITHVLFCFTVQAWGFLIAGALFFPVGVVHGIWLWFQ